MGYKIDFTAKSTKLVAINLAKRLEHNTFQVLVLPTGFGKTAATVATAGIIAHKMKRDVNVFVIAPRAKLDELSWEDTIEQYNNFNGGMKYKLHMIDKSTPQGLGIANKNDKIPKRDLKEMPPSKVKKMKFLKKWYEQTLERPTIFLIDEVHMFKNATAVQSKALNKLIKSSIGIGMSATPMSNGVLQDGISYLVMNNFYTSKSNCLNTHIDKEHYDKFYRPDVYLSNGDIDPNRFENLDLFMERIRATIYAPTVEVDFPLPEVTVYTMMYELSENTREHMALCNKNYRERRYDNFMQYLSDLTEAIGRDLTHARVLAKIILNKKPKQPLIFYNTNAELETIQFALEKIGMPYKMINGKSSKNKVGNVDKSDLNQAIIIQYKAGGAAIEFKQSNMSIFYGLQYSWQDMEQSFGRNVRRGSSHKVEHIFLLASHKHDDKVFTSLQHKKEFTDRYLEELAEELSAEDK